MNRFPAFGSIARIGFAIGTIACLAACGSGLDSAGSGGMRLANGGSTVPVGTTRLIERDVEAPEIFEVVQAGLWDGRPSPGGVWVALARATVAGPERVIIRNEDNGRFVIGALLSRETSASGPAFLMSSDAAAALDIRPGMATKLQVTALRRDGGIDRSATAAADGPVTRPGSPVAPVATAAQTRAGARDTDAAGTIAPGATPPARAHVQIGIFSIRENADTSARTLRRGGLEPTIEERESNGRRFWRVLVGPAQSTAERDAMLGTARRLGFRDAFIVAR